MFRTVLLFLLLLITPSFAAEAPSLRICTGGENGNYYKAGHEMANTLKGTVAVEVIQTNGSLDNLRKLEAGECDAAIVQSDAYGVYTTLKPVSKLNIDRMATLYDEYAHLVCNRNLGLNSINDVLSKGAVVAIGPQTSGTAVTWASLVKQDPKYATITTDSDPINSRTVLKLADATEIQCGLFISGLGAGTILEVDANSNDQLGLVTFQDGSFDDTIDPKGKRVYINADIPGGTYKNLQNYGWLGSQSDIPTIALQAVLVTNVAWADANLDAANDFAGAALQYVNQRK